MLYSTNKENTCVIQISQMNRTVLDAASPFDGCEKDAPQSMMLKPVSNNEAYMGV